MPKPVYLSGENGKPRLRPLAARLKRFEAVLQYLVVFVPGASTTSSKASKKVLACTPCNNYVELRSAWEEAMVWTDGLDHGLTSMLASIASVSSLGDQLWLKIIGCAGSGKSVLCEALSVSKKYIVAKSTIRGFHSGFTIDGGGEEEDNSLLCKLYGKTLVTKDGDTLIQSPNYQQILSEARDIYDGASRTHYRNKMGKDYERLRLTWLLCGTSSLRVLDQSELGERFLDCVIMEKIDEEQEDEVLLRVVNRAVENLAIEATDDLESYNDPAMIKAMQLTGGYVEWLRENAGEVLPTIYNSQETLLKCAKLGKFVAFMRARPSRVQDENVEREFAARLAIQLTRYANCLALVLNEKSVSPKVMKRTERIALDTGRGQSLEIVDYLYGEENGSEIKAIAICMGDEVYKTRRMLKFMQRIGIVRTFRQEKIKGVKGQIRWRLSSRFRKLYETVRSE